MVFYSKYGNYDPADIPLLVDSLKQGADLAIASRFAPGARNEEDDQLLRPRAWVNLLFTLIANLLFNRGWFVSDTINGFRASAGRPLNVCAWTDGLSDRVSGAFGR